MILSELIGLPVLDGGREVGRVNDLRFALDESPDDAGSRIPEARLYGVVVSPRSAASFLGYERGGVTRPWPLATFLRWRERGSFLVLWPDIEQFSTLRIVLRPDAQRWTAELTGSVTRHSHRAGRGGSNPD